MENSHTENVRTIKVAKVKVDDCSAQARYYAAKLESVKGKSASLMNSRTTKVES